MDKRVARRMGRFAQLAMAATALALADADLDELDPDRTGITIHTGAGGILEGDREVLARQDRPARTGPLYVPHVSANMAAANVAIQLGVRGPVTAGVGACAAGAIGVAEGLHMLGRGEADVVIAGASDAALTAPLVACLANAGALSTSTAEPATISRPFERDRTGFVPSEGAGIFVLEPLERARDRGAGIYCEVAGAAVGCDAFHITSPEPTGAGAEAVMRRALGHAGVEPEDVGCVVAHGTSTKLNDAAEAAAIGRVFGAATAALPVTAPKSVLGHGLGAAGAFGVATTALAVLHGIVPPTINYEAPDPDCPLRIVHQAALRGPLDVALTNAFGFGGQNAVVVVRSVP
jgi:3-oxoacyl-[acyl-carrier-protein] synthase II